MQSGTFEKIFFLNLGLKGVMEKCVGCFLAYLFWGGFFDQKGVTKQGGGSFKNALLPLISLLLLWKGTIKNFKYCIKNYYYYLHMCN